MKVIFALLLLFSSFAYADTYKVVETDGTTYLEVAKSEPETETYKIDYIRGRITAYEEAAAAKQAKADEYKALLVEYEKLEGK